MSTKIELTEIEKILGIEEFTDEHIDKLESAIHKCNAAANEGFPLVADAVYDRLISILQEVRPESGLLSHLWSDQETGNTEYTEHLQANPMMSIQTVKRWTDKELLDWVARLDEGQSLHLSYKIDGHAVRVVYDDGVLVSATSRARSSQGRDLTRQMRNILGEKNENLVGQGIVEIRGEICLHTENLEEARTFNPSIKSAFTAVSSLIKPSSTAEENQLLDYLVYRIIGSDEIFEYKSDEYQAIESLGFTTPMYVTTEAEEDVVLQLKEIIEELSEDYDNYGYFCDGIVAEIDDRRHFDQLGAEGIRALGNVALKVGPWGQDLYSGIVQFVEWTKGKTKLSPVAIVAEEPNKAVLDEEGTCWNMRELGVLTVHGSTVTRVPLYSPKNILVLEAYRGRVLFFRYGGESGVIPCDAHGNPLTESAVTEVLTR